jgi:ATP-dependent exoDNAse (exonuclease V) beta subunit
LESLEEGGILRDFSLLEQKLEIFYAKPSLEETRIDVMTIHGAKGLEFDVVIIPQLARSTRGSDRDLLVWSEDALAAQPQKADKDSKYELICKENSQKEAEEMKRLFYVACTRAKNALYLVGNVSRKQDGQDVKTPASNTLLRLIWDSVKEQFTGELRRRAPVQQSLLEFIEEGAKAETILRRLPADWSAPRPEPSISWKPELQRSVASTRKVSYEWVSDTSRHVGTVVHELLKRGSRGNPAMIEAELLRLGVAHAELAKAAARVGKAVNGTLNSKRGRWILQAHAEARSEWAISGRIRDKLIHGTIDRTFRDEEGRLWIIDFKTSVHAGGRVNDFLNEEQRRYQEQLENYATLLSRISTGPIWLGLYFPLLDGWREWQFAVVAAAALG